MICCLRRELRNKRGKMQFYIHGKRAQRKLRIFSIVLLLLVINFCMRILFFTKGNSSVASSRQRVWRVAERLHKQYGWDYEVLHSISYSLFSLRPSRFKILWNI